MKGEFLHMTARMIRIPHAEKVDNNTWFSFARGAIVTRRHALLILLRGPMRARIETTQSNNSNFWKVEDDVYETLPN